MIVELLKLSSQVLCSLIESTKDIKGVKVEDNKFCISVHYRNVEEKVRISQFNNLFWFLSRPIHILYKIRLCYRTGHWLHSVLMMS